MYMAIQTERQDRKQEHRMKGSRPILPLLLLLIVTVTGLIYWYSKDFSSRVELLVQKFRRAEDRGKCSGWNCTQLFAV